MSSSLSCRGTVRTAPAPEDAVEDVECGETQGAAQLSFVKRLDLCLLQRTQKRCDSFAPKRASRWRPSGGQIQSKRTLTPAPARGTIDVFLQWAAPHCLLACLGRVYDSSRCPLSPSTVGRPFQWAFSLAPHLGPLQSGSSADTRIGHESWQMCTPTPIGSTKSAFEARLGRSIRTIVMIVNHFCLRGDRSGLPAQPSSLSITRPVLLLPRKAW